MTMANPVSRTAYYCTGVRALDARSADPLVGDNWAEGFLGAEGREVFAIFDHFDTPNGANIVRHWVIEQWLKARLVANPQRRIVLVGAGFDSRALRLAGGRWFELDEAAIIDRKELLAPESASPNPLTRIAIDFARESLADKLAPHASAEPVTIVMEGVLYYLEAAAVQASAVALRNCFPQHELICDIQSAAFVRRYAQPVIRVVETLGAKWRYFPDDPIAAIEALGYSLREAQSLALRAAELKRIRIPAWLIRHLLGTLRDGYRACVFETR
ncbi:MAG: class I SAM-dependent methyltransferase [Betaproteobacteria bacterium]